jgi:hypothetical protein
MAKELEPQLQWREPTPNSSDEESSGSTEYESGEPLTPRAPNKRRTEKEYDLDFDPKGQTQRSSRVEDAPKVLASVHVLINTILTACV